MPPTTLNSEEPVSPYHIAWRIGGKNDEKKERQQKLHELLESVLEQYK